jgi:hypothetical protein
MAVIPDSFFCRLFGKAFFEFSAGVSEDLSLQYIFLESGFIIL